MIKKLLNKLSNSKLYVITFMISLFVISLLYIFNDVTPFGEKSLLCVDFYHQYGPMLGELYDRLHEGSSLLYSFSMGLGLPFFRNFLNYMSSPFNIIIMLFSRNNLVTSYSFIIGLKAVVASCTFVYFISHKFKTKELNIIPLGIIYAFSAYYSAYYWNIMWLDGMVFLPLITLGIEYIIKEGKWKFYAIWLAVMLISNYFIGYMICIFSVVYFLFFNIHEMNFKKGKIKESIKRFFKNWLLFTLGSIIAGLIAAVALLPMYYSMKSISATGGTIPTTQYYKFTVEDFLKYHLTGAPTTTFASDQITAPNVSAGILSVVLVVLFILNFDIPFKTKLCYGLILGFFILAFFNPQLDYVLHAFHVPNDLPYRYSFIYTFILVTIGAYAHLNIKNQPYIIVLGTYIFMMVLLLTITQDKWTGMNNNMIYINMILLTLYFVFYSGSHFINSLKSIFFVSAAAVAAIDVLVSINYNWNITQVLDTFYQDYEQTEELLDYTRNIEQSSFYRIDNVSTLTLNDPSWYNYYGYTTFSSMAYESMAKLQYKLGNPGNHINSYMYIQSTPIIDLMFDMKYFIGNTNDNKRYTPLKTNDETVNQFNYNVGLAFGVSNNLKNWNFSASNPFLVQNDFIYQSTGIDNTLEKMTPSKSEEIYNDGNEYIVRYEFDNPGDNMYFYTESYAIDFIQIGSCLYYKNDAYSNYQLDELNYTLLDSYSDSKVINIKSSDKKVYIYVGYNSYMPNSYYMYSFNQENFEKAFNKYNSNKLNITKFKEHYIEGNISTTSNFVYTSIPYDEGWHVYVDGNEVETYSLANTLLTFNISEGTHKIVFKFVPKGLIPGAILTLIGILLLFIKKIYKLIFKKKKTIKK
jgi:uncharacterized membrane protein YfhO